MEYPKSWLYRATYNKCIDYWRKAKRFETIELLEDCSVEDVCENQSEMKENLNQVLDRLKPQEKFLVVLYSEGLSYKEISEVIDMKFSSVGKTLSRVLKKIENELKYQYNELYN